MTAFVADFQPGIITGPMCILAIFALIGISLAWAGINSKSRIP